ncbi:MAG TPA: acetyl-CoA carboxylase biotin carboxyl carrier protein [Steroidobacteraceae bacterium]|nr:acetyl-CoA carboxylase biotin carboxyl carrier protein [Steroidobacteraceae bacterium]
MDIRKIKKLIELLEESGIAEIEIKEGEESVRIARASPTTMVTHAYPASYAPPAAGAAPQPIAALSPSAAAAAAAPAAAARAAAPAPQADEHVVTAPMVGTYYSSSAPGAKQFVDLGEEVKVGQVLCIIEAMKMMNQIESDKAGRIKAILVQNSEPVEFGQPLFIIE